MRQLLLALQHDPRPLHEKVYAAASILFQTLPFIAAGPKTKPTRRLWLRWTGTAIEPGVPLNAPVPDAAELRDSFNAFIDDVASAVPAGPVAVTGVKDA